MDDSSLSDTAAIILAAGKSTRMNSDRPKVLHEICGRPMLGFVLSACRMAGVDKIVVIVGHGKEEVMAAFSDDSDLVWVEQTEQRGTGHAVLCAQESLKDFDGSVLVIAGDMPLIRRPALSELLHAREASNDAATIATTMIDDPTGYGRIVRDEDGQLEAIVEQRDCTEAQQEIREVNPSYYCFDARKMFETLGNVQVNPNSGELYVTDVVKVMRENGLSVSATVSINAEDATGVNSRLDLAKVGRLMQDRIQLVAMKDGVTIVDPDTTWIEADVTLGKDTVIYPFSVIGVGAVVGRDCRVGPFANVKKGSTVPDGGVVGPVNDTGVMAT